MSKDKKKEERIEDAANHEESDSRQQKAKPRGTFRRLLLGGRKEDLQALDALAVESVESPARAVWNDFKARKSALLGIFGIVFMILLCFVGPYIWPVDILEQDPTMKNKKPGFYYLNIPSEVKNDALALSMGNNFGAGVSGDGELYLWGELSDSFKDIPELEAGEKWAAVACGNSHLIALTDKNNVYSWGDKLHGLPAVPEMEGTPIKVYAGRWVNSVITDMGKVYYWGAVLNWQLNPIRYSMPPGQPGTVVDQALARQTAILLLENGDPVVLDRTRDNIYGETPEHLLGRTVDVAATDQTVFALTDDGRVFGWGRNEHGLINVPEDIQGSVVQISAGTKHISALLEDGTVETWGENKYGQTDSPSRSDIKSIKASYHNTLYITEDDEGGGYGLSGYLMGTDENGRDIFRRLIYGGRVSLTVGAVAVIISAVIGILVGGLAGYFGGWVDMFLMRAAEVVNAIPFLPLAMILSALVHNKVDETGRIYMIMVILGILSWPPLSRLIRGQILAVREQEYVTAAKSLGIKERGIIFRHILPNVMNVILVSVTLSFATSILTESSLSFLGFGVTLPTPTWGNMVFAASNSRVVGEFWWRWFFPSLALAISTLSINMIGDALRDAVDPKTASR
ncbi:MAG: ABC transporter permease subunit [Clostridiaceae bacterium]|nr:ABC transporter permease subunit [Clostridiaceae bacterium]